MFTKLNLQFLLSYLGLIPFIFIIFNKYFLFLINEEILIKFIINYSVMILVFIGAINWNLEKNDNIKTLYGFIPSVFGTIVIILSLINYNLYNIVLIIVFFLFLQLTLDFLILYKNNKNKKPFYFLSIPLTVAVSISLLII